jgi:hypothetical protein
VEKQLKSSRLEYIIILKYILNNGVYVGCTAAQSKAWAVFALSNTAIVYSNHTRGMYVCVRFFCACGAALWRADPPAQGVLPIVYRIEKLKKRSRFKGL